MNKSDLTFTVQSCTPSTDEHGKTEYHVKLQYVGLVTAEDSFGVSEKKTQLTYYRWLTNKVSVGIRGKIDFAQFDIVEKEWETPDGEIVTLKQLKPKAQ